MIVSKLCFIQILEILSIFTVLVTNCPLKSTKIGCQVCHSIDPSKINVHLMPHSHDDVGWLKTVDDYYYGWHNEIQRACVKDIITTMVEALKANPDRRYIQVETAFFWKWWENSTEQMRNDFVSLVNRGQLEMINGAWSMNDEAATHYHSIIDQFTYGLRTINETVGRCGIPRIGWQIDPFGHSREQASIFAQLGFDAVFFARIDHEDKEQRIRNKDMEVIWRGSPDNNWDTTNIFTNMFPDFYFPPNGFCFDIECGDRVTPNNVHRKMEMLQKDVEKYAAYYRTKNVLIPMGGDFHFRSASTNFGSLDKLVEAFKGHESLNVIYSTPSCYVKAVNEEARLRNVEFTLKKDDFFPYGSNKHAYWTGYFSSRPTAKGLERRANNFLQTAKQLATFASIKSFDWMEDLTPLKQAIGIMQHHDAITGTAKQRVANDYIRLLTEGISQLEHSVATTIQDLLATNNENNGINLNLRPCFLSNITICPGTAAQTFVVTVYNPLERAITHPIRLPVSANNYKVTGPDGDEIVDIVDPISDFAYLKNYYGGLHPKELVFQAKNIPAFGIKMYHIKELENSINLEETEKNNNKFGDDLNGFEIDENTGLLKSVTLNGLTLGVQQDFLYYRGADGNNRNGNQASGAYIFRPKENEAKKIADRVVIGRRTRGKLVDEVRQEFAKWITQIIRVYKDGRRNCIEFDWLIGPVETEARIGTEIITRFQIANFTNTKTFYTDTNGRETIKRVLNKRDDYDYTSSNEPVSSNYYPINSKLTIKDPVRNLQVSVLNDRAQGGTSLGNGQLELMLHRRLMQDDDKGVNEPLNEIEFGQGLVVRGKTYLIFGFMEREGKSVTAEEREMALEVLLQPTVLVGGQGVGWDPLLDNYNLKFEGLKKALPPNIHIITLEPITSTEFVLRLEHFLERKEDTNLSQPVTVNLKDLFSLFDIKSLRETTLGANQWRDEFDSQPKFAWNLKDGKVVSNKPNSNRLNVDQLDGIVLEPMQIRTFIITVR